MRFVPAALIACLIALPAQAGFHVCNKTPRQTKVAIGLFDGRFWTSQGWWVIAPRTCQELVAGPLQARYYYLYATDEGAGSWDGHTAFCTTTADNFAIRGRADCEAHGFDRKGFFEIDTGQARDYTQTLSD